MSLTGTEAEVVNIVAKLKGASKNEINKGTGLSLDYIGYICRFLTKKNYLTFSNGRYYLAGAPTRLQAGRDGQVEALSGEPKIDKSFIREIADEVAKRIGRGTGNQGIRGSGDQEDREAGRQAARLPVGQVKIKTDFEVPIRDESLGLESNINKVGTKSEKEKFDINKLIESLTKIRKGGR